MGKKRYPGGKGKKEEESGGKESRRVMGKLRDQIFEGKGTLQRIR